MRRIGRKPQPGQVAFDGAVVEESPNRRHPYIIFYRGRLASTQPVWAYSADQAVGAFQTTREGGLGSQAKAILLDELCPRLFVGMSVEQAQGKKPYVRPAKRKKSLRKRPSNMVAWVVFDGNHQVAWYDTERFKGPILACSSPAALTGFRHKRQIDPGSQAYAIRLVDLIGTRAIPEEDFWDTIRPGLTEEYVRGVPELGRLRQSHP